MGELVRDLMTAGVETVKASDDLLEARDRMWRLDVRHLPVVDQAGKICGLLSQTDVCRVLGELAVTSSSAIDDENRPEETVADAMSVDVEAVPPDFPLLQAATLLYNAKLGCLPVVERKKVVGILTDSDFVRLYLEG